jgi:hypothetical protein
MFDFKNYVIKITLYVQHISLQLHVYTYEYNYTFHDSITASYLPVFFKFYINLLKPSGNFTYRQV